VQGEPVVQNSNPQPTAGKKPKRKVLGVATTPEVVVGLDLMAADFDLINKALPDHYNFPTTRSGVASWLLERHLGLEAIAMMWIRVNVYKVLQGDDAPLENPEDAETIAKLERIVETSGFSSLRKHMLEVAQQRKDESLSEDLREHLRDMDKFLESLRKGKSL